MGIYSDLIKISQGDFDLASLRLRQFRKYTTEHISEMFGYGANNIVRKFLKDYSFVRYGRVYHPSEQDFDILLDFGNKLISVLDEHTEEQINCSMEKYRIYTFPNGLSVQINNPETLWIERGGTHVILCSDRCTHVVRNGWQHLRWELRDD